MLMVAIKLRRRHGGIAATVNVRVAAAVGK